MLIKTTIDAVNDLGHSNQSLIIGNFDGVHKGHQSLLEHFLEESIAKKLQPVIMTFDPHPTIFLGKAKQHLIQSTAQKYKDLSNLGFNTIVEIPFVESVQKLAPREFIGKYILSLKGLKYIQLGHDFALGVGKQDSVGILKEMVIDRDINLCMSESIIDSGEVISSSLIRNYLAKGNLERVNQLLGKEYCLAGVVREGNGIGKKELVPTANINPFEYQFLPAYGVYISKTKINDIEYRSITNVGEKPSLGISSEVGFETHLFNYSEDIYQEEISVHLIKRIREEKKFDSLKELKDQIAKDIKIREEYYD